MNDMATTIPRLVRDKNRTQLLVHGTPFLMLAGEVHNSSSSSLRYMEQVWQRIGDLHCNTALVPVSWELIEPVEGQYDFSLVEGLIAQARAHGMRLIPLWFGTFKNTRSTYAPAWVKTDVRRFPRAQEIPGIPAGEITVCCEEARMCDARAFAALMRHIKAIDEAQQTVIMVQVENEVGILGDGIDYASQAQAAFQQMVPDELMTYLIDHAVTLHPRVRDPWRQQEQRAQGSWGDVFGEAAAWEIFLAWHFARFVGSVAAAGRAEYDLPMFANAWLAHPTDQRPGQYPSGGPVSHMLDIWRAAAPALDLLAPDIYVDAFAEVCDDYSRNGNPLLIPEARIDRDVAAKALYAFGQHGALCYAPFGIEDLGMPSQEAMAIANPVADVQWVSANQHSAVLLASVYEQLGHAMPTMMTYLGTGRARGILQQSREVPESFELGGVTVTITYNHPDTTEHAAAGGLIISPTDYEFIIIGYGFRIEFSPLPAHAATGSQLDFLSIWEGGWQDGEFHRIRRLNGDEYTVHLGSEVGARWVTLYQY